jgi:hypothetical protein
LDTARAACLEPLTINRSQGTRLDLVAAGWRIVDIGDLEGVRGKLAIDAGASLVMPGRCLLGRFSAGGGDRRRWTTTCRRRATIIGSVDIDRAPSMRLATSAICR